MTCSPKCRPPEVTEKFVAAIEGGYDLIVVNYANPDMVGHTGDLQAAIAACEAVDQGLAEVCAALEKAGGAMIVTADHGNCENMIDPKPAGRTPPTRSTRCRWCLSAAPVGAACAGPAGRSGADAAGADGAAQPDEMTGKA